MAALAVQAGGSRESPWRARRPRPPPSRAVCARHRYLTRRCADGAAGLADVGPTPTFCSFFLGLAAWTIDSFARAPAGSAFHTPVGSFLSPHAACEARVPYAHARERHLAQPTARLSSERAHKSTCSSAEKESATGMWLMSAAQLRLFSARSLSQETRANLLRAARFILQWAVSEPACRLRSTCALCPRPRATPSPTDGASE